MKRACRNTLAAVLTTLCITWAQGPTGIETRIGVLDLDVHGGDQNFPTKVLDAIRASLEDIGAYEIYTQKEMDESYEKLHLKIPNSCREPRCAGDIGSTLQMDRMIYGSVDKNDKTYGMRLTLIDVPSRQIIEKVSVEGEPGVSVGDVTKAAVSKLHGVEDENLNGKTRTYWDPPVHNEKQLAVSAGVCIAGGLVWSLATGSLSGRDENDGTAIYDYSGLGGEHLGVSAGAEQIPLFGRPGGMANAYTAVSDDAYGVFFNPAGLSWVAMPEMSLGYQRRLGVNSIAASYVNKATREIGFGQGFQYSGDNLESEVFFISGISYKVNELLDWLRPFSVGANLRIKSKKLSGEVSSPSQPTGSGFGFGLDFGFMWELSEHIRYGAMLKNAPSFYKYTNTLTDTTYPEGVPPSLQMGGSFKAGHYTLLVCEGYIPVNEDQEWKFAGGVERIMFQVMRVRLGVEKQADFDTPWKFTGGLGLDLDIVGKHVVVDASYEYNTLSVFAHPLNFSFRFGF